MWADVYTSNSFSIRTFGLPNLFGSDLMGVSKGHQIWKGGWSWGCGVCGEIVFIFYAQSPGDLLHQSLYKACGCLVSLSGFDHFYSIEKE